MSLWLALTGNSLFMGSNCNPQSPAQMGFNGLPVPAGIRWAQAEPASVWAILAVESSVYQMFNRQRHSKHAIAPNRSLKLLSVPRLQQFICTLQKKKIKKFCYALVVKQNSQGMQRTDRQQKMFLQKKRIFKSKMRRLVMLHSKTHSPLY